MKNYFSCKFIGENNKKIELVLILGITNLLQESSIIGDDPMDSLPTIGNDWKWIAKGRLGRSTGDGWMDEENLYRLNTPEWNLSQHFDKKWMCE